MEEFLAMIVFFLVFIAAPFLFVYGSYKMTDDMGCGIFAGSFVCVWYAFWIAAILAECTGVA